MIKKSSIYFLDFLDFNFLFQCYVDWCFLFFFFAKVDNVKVLFSSIQNKERNMIIDDKRSFVRRDMTRNNLLFR